MADVVVFAVGGIEQLTVVAECFELGLQRGASAYSVCVPLADGSLGIAWEAGDYDEVVFARISQDELGLAGSPASLVARAGRPGAAKPPEVAGG